MARLRRFRGWRFIVPVTLETKTSVKAALKKKTCASSTEVRLYIHWPRVPLYAISLPPSCSSPLVHVLQEKILREKVIVNANRVDFPPKPVVSEEAKSFIRSCLTYTHATRPDVHAMCKLPYLTTPAPKRGGWWLSSSEFYVVGDGFLVGIATEVSIKYGCLVIVWLVRLEVTSSEASYFVVVLNERRRHWVENRRQGVTTSTSWIFRSKGSFWHNRESLGSDLCFVELLLLYATSLCSRSAVPREAAAQKTSTFVRGTLSALYRPVYPPQSTSLQNHGARGVGGLLIQLGTPLCAHRE